MCNTTSEFVPKVGNIQNCRNKTKKMHYQTFTCRSNEAVFPLP